jgi:hypothetical protein
MAEARGFIDDLKAPKYSGLAGGGAQRVQPRVVGTNEFDGVEYVTGVQDQLVPGRTSDLIRLARFASTAKPCRTHAGREVARANCSPNFGRRLVDSRAGMQIVC